MVIGRKAHFSREDDFWPCWSELLLPLIVLLIHQSFGKNEDWSRQTHMIIVRRF